MKSTRNAFDYFPQGKKNSKIRIPISGSIALNEYVTEIIDTKEFQRLRGVKQLGPTVFVYPGASHSRFEHSLGVYNNAIRYLNRLLQDTRFNDSISENPTENIRALILAALLHDIGHYPYSHWIEELGDFTKGIKIVKHEARGVEIINRPNLKRIIEDKWEVEIQKVENAILNKKNTGDVQNLINSILSSVIDIDKTDYLVRDSIHCGINYGHGIDLERLIESLTVFNKHNKCNLTITSKGISSILSVLNIRNIMYQEVYWHKTVRCCTAMFKRFFFEYVNSKTNIKQADLNEIFDLTDDEFIAYFAKRVTEDSRLMKYFDLIKPFALNGRTLYKLGYLYKGDMEGLSPDASNFFTRIIDIKKSNFVKLVEVSNSLVQKLKSKGHLSNVPNHYILIEKAPVKEGHEKDPLDYLHIYDLKKKDFDPHLKNQLSFLNNFLKNNQHVYIFCHPSIESEFQKLVKDRSIEGVFEDITP